jgi:hypothetical protein
LLSFFFVIMVGLDWKRICACSLFYSVLYICIGVGDLMVHNSTNINKTNLRLSPEIIEHKTNHNIWLWKFSSGLREAQTWGRVKSVSGYLDRQRQCRYKEQNKINYMHRNCGPSLFKSYFHDVTVSLKEMSTKQTIIMNTFDDITQIHYELKWQECRT